MRDLNTLIPPNSGIFLAAAYGISANGMIVGRGLVGTHIHAFLLTPVLNHLHPPVSHGVGGG
ncbi:MAG TPA: hypothetical protein VG820_00295 [Fimbriimonadaceae bacterium]|nr:hypothetical protein [Fimbriimonadaceae bacterium]